MNRVDNNSSQEECEIAKDRTHTEFSKAKSQKFCGLWV